MLLLIKRLLQLSLILEPRMSKQLLSRGTLIHGLRESRLEEADGLFAYLLEVWLLVVDIGVNNHAFDLLLIPARIRIPSRQKHVRDDANAPHVDLLIVCHLELLVLANANDLRSHVEWTA